MKGWKQQLLLIWVSKDNTPHS